MSRPRPVVLLVAALLGPGGSSCRHAPRTAAPPSTAPAPLSPDHAAGLAALRAGRVAEAVTALAQAARRDPSSAAVHRDLGAALLRAGDVRSASEATAIATRLDASDVDAWVQLGSIQYSLKDPAAAQASFGRAAALAPSRADVQDWMGSSLFAQHVAALGGDNVDRAMVQAAIAAFERAVRLAPREPDYRLRLGLARRKLHDLAGAQADFAEAVRLGGRPECRMHLGETLLERGELATAERELTTALQANPDLIRALVQLARIRLGNGDASSARELLVRAAGLDPSASEPRFLLAAALRRLGDDPEAERQEREFQRLHAASEGLHAAEQAAASRPGDPAAHQALGQLREAAGDRKGAAECYARVIDIDPRHVAARVNLGGILLDAGRPDAALPHLEQAARIEPEIPQVHVNLGLAKERLGDAAGALAEYREAARLAPADAGIRQRIDRLAPVVARASR